MTSGISLQTLPSPHQFAEEDTVLPGVDQKKQRTSRRGSKFEANHHNIRRSHKSSDYILSVLSLSQWIQSYGARSDQDLDDEGDTFVDAHGVKRYVSSWKAVPEVCQLDQHDPTFRRLHHNLTGCIQHSIHCVTDVSEADLEAGRSGLSSRVVKVSFLNDWQRLWYFLEDDDEDELAQQTPLFRLAIEFIFHRRTYQFYFFSLVYIAINDAILYHFFPYSGSEELTWFYVFDALVRIFTYVILYRLFRGDFPKLFNHKYNSHARDREMKKKKAEEAEVRHKRAGHGSYSHLHWTSSLRQLVERSFREMYVAYDDIRSNMVAYDDSSTKKQRGSRRPLTYYDLLNISMKFFTRHNGANTSEMRWNRTSYRLMILFVVFGFPLYVTLHTQLIPYLLYILQTCSSDFHNDFCQFYFYRIITTGGAILPIYANSIFGGSVLISLVGLAYGGEIANRLADTWMEKFCCLRRLPLNDDEDDCYILKTVEEEEDSVAADVARSVVLKDGDSSDSDSDASPATTSALHQRVVHTLLPATTAHHSSSSSSKKFRLDNNLTHEEKTASKELIGTLINRDATEHYLFIREMMQAADRIWSPVLTTLFIVGMYISLSIFLYILFTVKSSGKQLLIQLLSLIVIRLLFLFIYPIVSLSHANSYIYKLQNCFKVASSDDYAIIGGRDRWIAFMTDTPAVWTYYGIWITWDRLSGILWTGLAAIGAYVFTLLTAN